MQIQMYYCLTGLSVFCLKCFLALMVLRLIIMNFRFKLLSPFIAVQCRRPEFDPLVRKIPWRREWLPTPEFLPGEFCAQRSLEGYSPWGHKESDMTKHAHTIPQNCSSNYWIFQSRILEWVVFPFSRRASQTRYWTWSSVCILIYILTLQQL